MPQGDSGRLAGNIILNNDITFKNEKIVHSNLGICFNWKHGGHINEKVSYGITTNIWWTTKKS